MFAMNMTRQREREANERQAAQSRADALRRKEERKKAREEARLAKEGIVPGENDGNEDTVSNQTTFFDICNEKDDKADNKN